MLILAALLLGAPIPPDHAAAVFWAGERTWLADVDAGVLYTAPGWHATLDGGVWRFRLVAEASRPRTTGSLPGAPSRWTVLQAQAPGARVWRPLTPPPIPPGPADGVLEDERAALQFLGDVIVLARFRRRSVGDGPRLTAEIEVRSLPEGAAAPAPPPDGIGWIAERLPGLIDPCVRAPLAILPRDLVGGRRVRFLALGAQAARCAGDVHLLRLDPPTAPAVALAGGGRWRGGAARLGGQVLEDVVDLRTTRGGERALVLRGEPTQDDAAVQRDPARMSAACPDRTLWAWRGGGAATPLGAVPRLDGLRWLAPDDPLRTHAALWLAPPRAPCVVDPRAPAEGPTAHACRVDEAGRPWGGLADLAARAQLRSDGRTATLEVEVVDPGRHRDDGLQVWVGARRPVRVELGADRLTVRRAAERAVRPGWRATPHGYTARLDFPAEWLGDPPALSVRVEDVDPDLPGAVALWAAGSRVDGRNPAPAPLPEAP